MSVLSPPVYDIPSEDQGVEDLVGVFEKKFGSKPSFISRAPGRVNLIGEHIDYMGYGVLPMAIEQDVMVAGRTNNLSLLRLSNVDDEYKSYECSSAIDSLAIDRSAPKWHHYVLCGFLGIVEKFSVPLNMRMGMDLVICGRVPPSAGLSSSSALVSASALITYQLIAPSQLSKTDLAQICCDCERYIGTQGGGMDQSISFLAEKGKAKKIDFDPIRATDVQLPDGHLFVISHCLAELNKAATNQFNQRVVECRLACQILAKKSGLQWKEFRRLGDLQSKLGKTLEEMISLVKEHLHENVYSKLEVLETLECKADSLLQTSLSDNTAHLQEFKLYQRATHVFTESWRVEEFKKVTEQVPVDAQKLGKLMDESHASTRDTYECSHPSLDILTQLCRESGALGSRLTGAGWGGCAVSLIPESNKESFMEKVSTEFFSGEKLNGRPLSQVLFVTSPAAGACLYKC
ncbi:N-acetylgalactosamine kinase-like [Watersipora subatra]|uniref:N-acetylgalactosamine kinase-like n=1 Tax=Watersipora subatra TaxID=2589382 RepID=UPI00355B30F1